MKLSRAAARRSLNRILGIALAAVVAIAGARADTPAFFAAEFPPAPARFGVTLEAGDLASAKAWLDRGLDPNYLADRIGSGLMIGAWEGNLAMMELFFARGADVNLVNRFGEQALLHAAWKGHLDAVRWLLDRGAEINRDGWEWSALHYAVFAGHGQVARLLLERGADIDALSTNGSSVLMMAAREGHEDLARLLLERGADTQLRNEWGDGALEWAMRHDQVRIAKMVAAPEEFAAAARRAPESFGQALRSVPVPAKVDALLKKMRALDAEGRLSDDLLESYLIEIAALEQERERKRRRPAAAAQPRDSGAPAGANAEALRQKMRALDAEGRLSDDLLESYLIEIARLEQEQRAAAPAARPRALEIRARRDAPGQEEAVLIRDPAAPPQEPELPPIP